MTNFELNLHAQVYYRGCLAKNEIRDAALLAQDRVYTLAEDALRELKDFHSQGKKQ